MVSAFVVLTAPAGPAAAQTSGPRLTVATQALDTALNCTPDVAKARQNPVLLIPGTGTTATQSFGWNYLRAFAATGVPHCALTLPAGNSMDIATNAEFVVHAIRKIHDTSKRKVAILGWSQGGGPEPRWALRWWPDTRAMVASVIGLDPPNHGSTVIDKCAQAGALCPPAMWQMRSNSRFIAALNRGPQTFPGISYTVIYSKFSDVVQPNSNGRAARLPSAPNVTNVALQDFCGVPTVVDPTHLGVLSSAVSYGFVRDALAHPNGPANRRRVDRSLCTRPAMPYYDAAGFYEMALGQYAIAVARLRPDSGVSSEPPLPCYAAVSGTKCRK